jgi:hypothetical protein
VAQALVIPASSFSIAWSTVNEGAFWRGGKSANVARKLLHEQRLPVVESEGDEVAVVGHVEVAQPRVALTLDDEERQGWQGCPGGDTPAPARRENQALTGLGQLATVEIRPALPPVGQKVPALTHGRPAWPRSSRGETAPRGAAYVPRFLDALDRTFFAVPG